MGNLSPQKKVGAGKVNPHNLLNLSVHRKRKRESRMRQRACKVEPYNLLNLAQLIVYLLVRHKNHLYVIDKTGNVIFVNMC